MQEALATRPIQDQHPGQLNREIRARTDTATWLAEVLNGNMRTSFEFSFDGQELYGEDGGGLTEVFDNAIQDAHIIAHENPTLLFEVRRRLIEGGELDDIKAMARGELYTDDGEPVNTIAIISDYPPELMDTKEDVGGYNSTRKQAMLRVVTLEENGLIKMTTQSLDQSNRPALEAMHRAMGQETEDGELLGQRANLALRAEGQSRLVDNLRGIYDESMSRQFGGEWYGGRRPADDRNTYDFVCGQHDLLDWFTAKQLADPVAAEKLRYGLAATAKARYERYLKGQSAKPEPVIGIVAHQSLVSVEAIANGQNLSMEINREGRRAARRGETFSGCGVTETAEGDDLSTKGQLRKAGYGNKLRSKSDDEDCEFVSKKCPECGTKDVKTKVSKVPGTNKKHISGSCGCSKTV